MGHERAVTAELSRNWPLGPLGRREAVTEASGALGTVLRTRSFSSLSISL